MSVLLAMALAAAASATPAEVTIPGPDGAISGTLLDPGGQGPAIVIIPGSGPTDRDGNNPMGVKAAPYRQLAEALAARGIATLRADKRGLFASKPALADPNKVTIADYAADAHAWAKLIATRTGRRCVWLLGHSEGGLIALQAAQQPEGLCGIILVASPGRPLAQAMREQFRSNPANAPILDSALAMIDAFEAGKTVDPATLKPPLGQLFPSAVQPFLIDMFAHDPAVLAGKIALPVLIVQGDQDLQVSMADADALAKGAPAAERVTLTGVNHVLKHVPPGDRAANLVSYGDAAAPIAPELVDAVAGFVTAKR